MASSSGTYRGVYTKLIDDIDFQALSSEARHVLLTLRLCSQNTAASIFRYYPEVLRSQTGYSAEILDAALAELACSPSPEAPWIYREGLVVWIRNGLRHDPNMKLADRKHRTAVERALGGLPRGAIVAKFCDYYRIPRPFDGPPEALGRPIEGVNRSGSPRTSTRTSSNPPIAPPLEPPEPRPKYGRQSDGSFRIHDGMFNDCPEGKAGMCVKAEFIDHVPLPKQCAVHREAQSS